MTAPYLAVLTDAQQAVALLNRLNPWHGHNNCPAAAAAVHHYLSTSGAERPAHAEDICFGYVVAGNWTSIANIGAIYTRLASGAEGNHVVMHGIRSETDEEFTVDHYCNLVKIGTEVYLLDASVTPRTAISGRTSITGFCTTNRFIRYEIATQYQVTQEPNPETAHRQECRDVGRSRSLVHDYMRH